MRLRMSKGDESPGSITVTGGHGEERVPGILLPGQKL